MNPLATIAARAGDNLLHFLVAGGHAVIAHGYARATFGFDLIIPREEREKWTCVLGRADFSLFQEGPTFLQFNPPGPEDLPLNLMLVSNATFEKLEADAAPAASSDVGAKVVSLRHLLALKCHAIKHGHPGRIVKDADDVISLVQANGLEMNGPGIRDRF